eukprot:6666527-Prymnesium_polylepis.1
MAGTRESRSRASAVSVTGLGTFCALLDTVPLQKKSLRGGQGKLYLPFQRRSGRHGDVAAATSSSSA